MYWVICPEFAIVAWDLWTNSVIKILSPTGSCAQDVSPQQSLKYSDTEEVWEVLYEIVHIGKMVAKVKEN